MNTGSGGGYYDGGGGRGMAAGLGAGMVDEVDVHAGALGARGGGAGVSSGFTASASAAAAGGVDPVLEGGHVTFGTSPVGGGGDGGGGNPLRELSWYASVLLNHMYAVHQEAEMSMQAMCKPESTAMSEVEVEVAIVTAAGLSPEATKEETVSRVFPRRPPHVVLCMVDDATGTEHTSSPGAASIGSGSAAATITSLEEVFERYYVPAQFRHCEDADDGGGGRGVRGVSSHADSSSFPHEHFRNFLRTGQRCVREALEQLDEVDDLAPPHSHGAGHAAAGAGEVAGVHAGYHSSSSTGEGGHDGYGAFGGRGGAGHLGGYYSSEDNGFGSGSGGVGRACRHDGAGAGIRSGGEGDAMTMDALMAARRRATATDVVQLMVSLAFSCPSVELAAAAQLVLADGFAHLHGAGNARQWCFGLIRYLPQLQQVLAPPCGSPAGSASEEASDVVQRGLHVIASDASMDAALQRELEQLTVEERRQREQAVLQILHHYNTATPGGGSGGSGVPGTLHVYPNDHLLWFDHDGGVHVVEVSAWLCVPPPSSPTVPSPVLRTAVCSPLPVTTALPLIQRLVVEDGVAERRRTQWAIQRAVRTTRASPQLGLNSAAPKPPMSGGGLVATVTRASSGTSTSGLVGLTPTRRRRQGANGVGGESGEPAAAGGAASPSAAETAPSSGEAEANVNASGGDCRAGGAATVTLTKAQARQRCLLSALSQSHLFPTAALRFSVNATLYAAFNESGECPNYYRLLALYPEVLRAHHAAMHFVLFDDGPLPLEERLMTAIMAASRHKCEYLVSRFAALLLRFTGERVCDEAEVDPYGDVDTDEEAPYMMGGTGGESGEGSCLRWLTQGPPPRLRCVRRLIALAAHTPWLLGEDDIRDVLRGGWTVPELFQLDAILAHVLPLCGFVMGLIVPTDPWTAAVLPPALTDHFSHRAVLNTRPLGATTSAGSSGNVSGMAGLRRYGSGTAVDTAAAGCPAPAIFKPDIYTRYCGEDSIVSEQRIKGSLNTNNPHTLWRSRFNWPDAGATLMEQYYPGAAALFDEEMDSFSDVTRQLSEADCVGLKGPGFTQVHAFRSLQLYVLNVLGFMVEDYSYNDINKVLRRPAKWFAHVLTLRPETLSREEVVHWYMPASTPASTSGGSGGGGTSSSGGASAGRAGGGGGGGSTAVSAGSHASTTVGGSDSAAVALAAHQLKREIELLAVVERSPHSAGARGSAGGGGGGSSSGGTMAAGARAATSAARHSAGTASATGVEPSIVREDVVSVVDAEVDDTSAQLSALALQDERVLLLTALATMEARKEGLLHILLYPLCTVLNNM